MRLNLSIILAMISIIFLLSGSECFSSQTEPPLDIITNIETSTLSSDTQTTVTQEDEILVRSPRVIEGFTDKTRSYFVQSGGAFAIHDKDFREFLDYGASINFGVKQKIKPRISLVPTLGLVVLKGEWRTSSERDIINVEAEEWYPGYISGASDPITAEDVNEENLGTGYHGEAEAVITSAELLQRLQLDTTLYIIPLALNVRYQLHEGEKRISPYVGGGLGFCVARREVESDVLKERYYQGPMYSVRLDNSQTVTGRLVQFFAGFEMPLKHNIKLVAEATTTLYSLNNFDPVLVISHRTTTPDWYDGTDLSTWSYEDPIEVGVFKEEFVSSLSIGFVWPF